MDVVANPFRPGAGQRPPMLAGRESLIEAFNVVRQRAEEAGEGDASWILYGLQGVGKTVLLNELFAQVSDRGWITAKVDAGAGLPLGTALSQALVRGIRTATGRHPAPGLRRLLQVFSSFSLTVDPRGSLSVGADVTPERGTADTGRFTDDLTSLFDVLAETARNLGMGVLVTIDELQEATPGELAAVNTALHALRQAPRPAPLTLIGAGLPSLPAKLAEVTSYAKHLYDYRCVGLLDGEASRDALTVPTHGRDVRWKPEALDAAVAAARGHPLTLQTVGKHVWDLTRRSPISNEDVGQGLVAARREVDDRLYRFQWDRATPGQRDVLRAVAALTGDGPARVADVAARTGKASTSDISVARHELIRKRLLHAPKRGQLAFTVPGMHEFIDRQPRK